MAGEMSQGPSKWQTIKHFTHNHPLTQVNGIGAYTCGGCKLRGEGKSYRCSDCDYNVHEYCARCPNNIRNSCHGPDHELKLYSGPAHMTVRSCYVCRVYIQGMFYKCKQCNFESHPLCTVIPMHTSSPKAILTTQRSLLDHAGQPSSPSMRWSVPHPHGGHHQHLVMNPGSPKADSKSGPSTPKKKGRVIKGAKVVLGVTATIATHLIIASVTGLP